MTKAATEYTSVTMDDGRVVEFPGKRKMQRDSEIVDGRVYVRFDFRNGETRRYELPQAMLLQFAAHGGIQRYGDATAGLENIDDAVLAVDSLAEQFEKGQWAAQREASSFAGASILQRALVEVSGKTPAEIKAFLEQRTPAEKAALRLNPRLADTIKRLEAERATARGSNVDSEALLATLGDI